MTARISLLTVILQRDMRDDSGELKALVSAISQLRGVGTVTGTVLEPGVVVARARVRREIATKLEGLLCSWAMDGLPVFGPKSENDT